MDVFFRFGKAFAEDVTFGEAVALEFQTNANSRRQFDIGHLFVAIIMM